MEISKMPVIFVGHGSPLSAIEDDEFAQAWKALGAKLPKPRGILAISAHFYTNGTYVTVNSKNDLIYDFYGFPEALYQVKYPTLGDPVLAEEIAQLIPSAIKVKRGLDHEARRGPLDPREEPQQVQRRYPSTQDPRLHLGQ
jgi:Uncharacterized conserved protein